MAVLFGATALVTANWLDYAFIAQQGHGYPLLLKVALAGSVAFGMACCAALFGDRYGLALGIFGVCLSWPYFAVLSSVLPWDNFLWLLRIHYHGVDQVMAVLILSVASIYCFAQLWHLIRGRGAEAAMLSTQ